jgi:SPP1 gp7 family putative phage head morphogenesis protein
MILGTSLDKVTAAVAAALGASKANASRLVRTEMGFFAVKAQRDALDTLDVEEYQVVETLDGVTCPTCGAMDGRHFPMAQFQAGMTAPLFHPNCRGCISPYFEDEADYSTQRIARDENGKNYYVRGDMSYAEWKKAFIDGGDKTGLTFNENGGMISSGGDDGLSGLNEASRAADEIARTLREEEIAIKDLDFETGIVIGRDGNVLERFSGEAHSVDVSSGAIKGNIFTHNHPGDICAFSAGDIFGLSIDGAYELRAVTRDGRFVSLREDSDILRSASLADAFLNAGFGSNNKLFSMATRRAIDKYGVGRFTAKQRNGEVENIINEWLREYAAKYGYKFTEGSI